MIDARVPKPGRFGALLLALLVIGACLVAPTAASAGTVTVGAQMTQRDTMTLAFTNPTTVAIPTPGEPEEAAEPKADFVSPVDGVIRRWRLAPQQTETALYALRVLRPTGTGSYTAVATSQAVTASTSFTLTYPTALPIQAGDLIGLDALSGSPHPSITAAYLAGAEMLAWDKTDITDGETRAPDETLTHLQPTFNVDVEAAPRIVLITPATGPSTGGTTVKIVGANFSGATSVSFGGQAAAFTVDSDEEITATAPSIAGVGSVAVTVTSAAGTSRAVGAGQFAYTAPTPPYLPPLADEKCVVPRLTGMKLVAARAALARANCKLGRVTGKRRPTAKVLRQSPTPRAIRKKGTAVNVKLTAPPGRPAPL